MGSDHFSAPIRQKVCIQFGGIPVCHFDRLQENAAKVVENAGEKLWAGLFSSFFLSVTSPKSSTLELYNLRNRSIWGILCKPIKYSELLSTNKRPRMGFLPNMTPSASQQSQAKGGSTSCECCGVSHNRTDKYELGRTIRSTIYGKVKLARLRLSELHTEEVAVKLSDMRKVRQRKHLEDPLSEVRFLKHLTEAGGHPNVLRLVDEFVDATTDVHWAVVELCRGGELFDAVENTQGRAGLGESRARRLFRDIAAGLQYIHAAGLCHLDLSTENVLLTAGDSAKVIDLGQARFYPGPGHLFAGSAEGPGKLRYKAPEIFNGEPFDGRSVDVYSLGVVLFCCLTGVPPYEIPSLLDARFKHIIEGRLHQLLDVWGMTGPDYMHSSAVDLMQRMLSPADRRITLAQVMQHPWVTGTHMYSDGPTGLSLPTQPVMERPWVTGTRSASDMPAFSLPTQPQVRLQAASPGDCKLSDGCSHQTAFSAFGARMVTPISSTAVGNSGNSSSLSASLEEELLQLQRGN